MPITPITEWQTLALYAVAAALVLTLLTRLPYVGRFIRAGFSFALLALAFFVLLQQAPFQPSLARFVERIGLDNQEVAGGEIRIRIARDGHFWADATINGVSKRMLVDSGATVTAISAQTADRAGVEAGGSLVPVMLQTANGPARAETGTVKELQIGPVRATNLKVVVSPALGTLDVLGMNFLSQLASWRVEDNVLVLVPHAD